MSKPDRKLALTPKKLRPYPWDDPANENKEERSAYGHHAPFCTDSEVKSVKQHTPLRRSSSSYLAYLPDATGVLHQVTVERVKQYAHGVYDAAEYRKYDEMEAFVRLLIDPSDDALEDVAQGICLTSGEARQVAAILIAEADRADGIRPNT